MTLDQIVNKMNERIANINDEVIDLQLGLLFNSTVERLDASGDIKVNGSPHRWPRTTQTVVFLELYRFLWRQVKTIESTRFHPLSSTPGYYQGKTIDSQEYSYFEYMLIRSEAINPGT